ncbi:sugar ABC transporter substrate-binding protein [Actinoplanes sp. OR16]|uniref:ABC transporter substrate-binding protein n=1 Tax=Actinoplanes sp. OR16 TaxID=946334 RepID=UPI000F6DD0B2|nr:sugar ABC transporter substrate-binding protein [Actinoplanes sp. OR16]BBH71792.1 sugar ABC transporter substrate-binding protein [Actinoplanes sp. OR16]
MAPRTAIRGLLASVSAVLLLGSAACAGDDSAGEAADTLEVWTRSAPEPAATYKDIFAAFTAKTGIAVDYQPVVEFDQQLQARASSKDLPDVFVADAANLGTYQAQGWLQPIDRAGVAGGADVAANAWSSVQGLDGQTYGIPFSRQAFTTFIRKDWREKVGLPVPKTWADLTALAKAFAEKDPDGNGKKDTYGMVVPGSAQNGYTVFWGASYLWQGGGDIITDAGGGKYSVAINNEKSVQAVSWIRDQFCTPGVVQPGALTQTTAQTTHFTDGTAGIYFTGPYNFVPYDQKLTKEKYEVVPAPTGPAGGAVLANGENIYLGAGSKLSDAQKKLAEFLITPEAQKLGMVSKTQAVVRLPVNATLDAAEVTGDERWKVVAEAYAKNGTEFPSAVQWVPIRNAAAEGLNKVLADCSGDVKAGLDATAQAVTAVLQEQGVLA